MNIYKILITHASPKSNKTAIKEFIIASNDSEVFEYLKISGYTYWDDIEKDDDMYGDVKKIDFIFENKGDYELETKWEDLYYGSTMYQWELFKEHVTDAQIDTLIELGIAKLI